jgi:hypothetical protein
VLFQLAYLSVANVFALLRLPQVSDRDKDVGILALRHQITLFWSDSWTRPGRRLPDPCPGPGRAVHLGL